MSTIPEPDPQLTPAEAAAILDVHPASLARWADQGVLPATRRGDRGHRTYRATDIHALRDLRNARRVAAATVATRTRALHHIADRVRVGILAEATVNAILPALVHPDLSAAAARMHLMRLGRALAAGDEAETGRRTAALLTGVDPAHTAHAAMTAVSA